MSLTEVALPALQGGAITSFWMGGFEGADHRNRHGDALDMARLTGHADSIEADFDACAELGLRGVRESIGWRLAEPAPGRYDFDRARAIARAARERGMQVLWTFMHYGTPADVSLHDDALIDRFAAFARAGARALAEAGEPAPVYNLINEIGYLSWAASASDSIHPYRGDASSGSSASGYAIKRRLVRAVLAAIDAVREIDPRARFLHVEPLLHVAAPVGRPDLAALAERIRGYQWQVWDLLEGRFEPDLGGRPDCLDLIGVNHYHDSQWEVPSEQRLSWSRRDPRRMPFAELLDEAWQRYRCPMLVAETGHIGKGRAAWLHEIAGEVLRARRAGVPIEGLCLYPVRDRPSWNDLTRWHDAGVFERTPAASRRPRLCEPLAQALRAWQPQLLSAASGRAYRPALIVFSHLRWNSAVQRPRQLLGRLAAQHPVVFIEEPLFTEGPPKLERRSVAPQVEVWVPHTNIAEPGLHASQLPAVRALLDAALGKTGIADAVVWFTTPMALPLVAEWRPRAIVYDCADDLSGMRNAPPQWPQWPLWSHHEAALMKAADLVLTRGPTLHAMRRGRHPNIHGVPNAVDARSYAPASLQHDGPLAAEACALLPAAAGPRLGFFGVIDERFDLALLTALADAPAARTQGWQLVMVGPVDGIDPAALPRRPNLHWLGMQDDALLPYLAHAWDLCLLPFITDESTRSLCPPQALEYFAAGKPVVSTPILDVAALYGDAAHMAEGTATFIAACDAVLHEPQETRRARLARMNTLVQSASWERSVDEVERLLSQVLESRRSTPSVGASAEPSHAPALQRQRAGLS